MPPKPSGQENEHLNIIAGGTLLETFRGRQKVTLSMPTMVTNYLGDAGELRPFCINMMGGELNPTGSSLIGAKVTFCKALACN